MSHTKTDWFLRLGLIVVVLFVLVLVSTFAATIWASDKPAHLLALTELLLGWEELLAVVLGGTVAVFKGPASEYLKARTAHWTARTDAQHFG